MRRSFYVADIFTSPNWSHDECGITWRTWRPTASKKGDKRRNNHRDPARERQRKFDRGHPNGKK